ncbi:MAG TPA: NAD(P) transhydrogenase subunit alpha, partial [Candidatus Babeliaceae bacterium]|nr:NAD(P) transhydrogenase subunit alpha [Candidatus Babeliaceae bacterium]
MRIAIPKEIVEAEQRVALVPSLVQELVKLGCTVLVEKNAGTGANYLDDHYKNVTFYDDKSKMYQDADVILKVQPPIKNEISLYKKNSILISFLFPTVNPDIVKSMRDCQITSFAMENIPRITRAQAMDALSSQATVSGYKAALLAANYTNRFIPMLTTAAGTIRPTQVLVIGAGVAGLQAIATMRRLGAIVSAYDIRPSTKEQVESLGAKMINIDVKADALGGYARELNVDEQNLQKKILLDALSKTEVVITTAQIPGKSAPKIITKDMLDVMMPGSLVIDIAADSGGNCELTQRGQSIAYNNVMIYGPLNLPSMMARDASNMYAKNIVNFL